jgi:hypothetical protein
LRGDGSAAPETKEEQMDTREGRRSDGPRRAIVTIAVGVLALAVVASGCATRTNTGARAGRSDAPSLTTPSPQEPSPSKETRTPSPKPDPSPTIEPTPDPYALADGVYPTLLRRVDVSGYTITVDVVQLFRGQDAVRAAREDGMSWKDSRYLDIYIRNENPLLRTLSVDHDASIVFVGGCEFPSTHVGLVKLSKATVVLTKAYYYDVAVRSGSVTHVDQHYRIQGC